MRAFHHEESTKDAIRPQPQEAASILEKSQKRWSRYLPSATCQPHLSLSCANLGQLLHQTPAIPDDTSHEIKEIATGNSLLFEGQSQWEVNLSAGCSLESNIKASRTQRILIGSSEPNYCSLSEHKWWPGFSTLAVNGPSKNLIAVFVLAWSYVLSVRMVELRRKSQQDEVLYSERAASTRGDGALGCPRGGISIRATDLKEHRWWESILANGCGWNAVLFRSGRAFHPPWSYHLNTTSIPLVLLNPPNGTRDTSLRPPSSQEAYQYLWRFAKQQHCIDQLIAAFAATLMLPVHNRYGLPVLLPAISPRELMIPKDICEDLAPRFEDLPHFMALSCIPNAIPSSLFGCFWEPNIDCRLASHWLHPLLTAISAIPKNTRVLTLVKIMSYHRPKVASLWLGAALTGLVPGLLDFIAKQMPPLSPEAAVWTRTPQSFMDLKYESSVSVYIRNALRGSILRRDIYHTLYATDVKSKRYPSLPMSPWPPFGSVKLKDAPFEVQRHSSCKHQLTYQKWLWKLQHDGALPDIGATIPAQSLRLQKDLHQRRKLQIFKIVSTRSVSKSPLSSPDETLSRCATRGSFRWALPDGISPLDMKLWNHEWLRDYLQDDSDDE